MNRAYHLNLGTAGSAFGIGTGKTAKIVIFFPA